MKSYFSQCTSIWLIKIVEQVLYRKIKFKKIFGKHSSKLWDLWNKFISMQHFKLSIEFEITNWGIFDWIRMPILLTFSTYDNLEILIEPTTIVLLNYLKKQRKTIAKCPLNKKGKEKLNLISYLLSIVPKCAFLR